MTTIVTVGLGMAALGFGGKYAANLVKTYGPEIAKRMPKIDTKVHYRGGFEEKMSKTEAYQILGVGPTADVKRIRDAHRRIMIINHPDRGGSPFLASKINEAKDMLDKKK